MCGGGWLHARVLRGWKDRYEVSAVHGEVSDEHEAQQSRRCRETTIGVYSALHFAAATRRRPNPQTSQNQPEREFLAFGENPEIRKIRNNKQKCTKPESPKDPAKRTGCLSILMFLTPLAEVTP